MHTIVHITCDYPDDFQPRKTNAVKNLIEQTTKFKHIVYSLNRTSGIGNIVCYSRDRGGAVTCLTYPAPPYGILLHKYLKPVAEWILADLKARNISPDCIHAHKFSVEGLVADKVAKSINCPFVCNLWGHTDQRVIRYKPEMRRLFRKTASRAALLFPATPWIGDYIANTLGVSQKKYINLPIITLTDQIFSSQPSERGLVSMFDLDFYDDKGLVNLCKALASLKKNGMPLHLDIYGDGRKDSVHKVRKIIASYQLEDLIILAGRVPHEDVQKTFATYSGFVMPSLRESYGMVFIEALLSGLPILYPAERAIDGYFDDVDIGYKCDRKSSVSIADGLKYIVKNETRLKQNIATLQKEHFFDQFRVGPIVTNYSQAISQILTTNSYHRSSEI